MAKNCHAFTAMERSEKTKTYKKEKKKHKPQTGTYQYEPCQK